jgi:predicted DNA-binding transcriptional regulator YafY
MTGYEIIHWLYGRLKQKAYPNRPQFLDHFEVSASTFKRDLAFLRDRLGAPIDYHPRRQGYFLTDTDFELPSFWFNRHHLLILAGICHQLELFALSPRISNLRSRLLALLAPDDGQPLVNIFSFETVGCATCDNANLDTLAEAGLTGHLVNIVYRAAQNGDITSREVEPYRLHNYMGAWYLIGFCRERQAPRSFQLGRILELQVLPEKIGTHRFSVEEYIAGAFGIFKGAKLRTVVLDFSPAMARIVGSEFWHHDQRMEPRPDGVLRLSLPVADLTEIRMKVLQYGREVEVVAPEELRQQVAAEGLALFKMYERKK